MENIPIAMNQPKIKVIVENEQVIDGYKQYLITAVKNFISNDVTVTLEPWKDVKKLAQFIDDTTGEYNFFTVKNKAYVPLKEAIAKNYLYIRDGRPRMMESNAILEWVYFHHPELEDGLDLEEVEKLKKQYLESDEIYPFFKIDAIDVNVLRRMTRGSNTPEQFMLRNLKGLAKKNNGHLKDEEELTRKYLYNTYASLYKLWELGLTPTVIIQNKNEEEVDAKFQTN